MSLYDDLPPVGSTATDEIPTDISERQETNSNSLTSQNYKNQKSKSISDSFSQNQTIEKKPKSANEEWNKKKALLLQNAVTRKKQQQQQQQQQQQKKKTPIVKTNPKNVIETKQIFDQVNSSESTRPQFVGIIDVDDPYDPMKPNDYEDILDERVGKIPNLEQRKKAKVEVTYKKNESVQSMMNRMGYQEGQGLGKSNQGRANPLILTKSGEIR